MARDHRLDSTSSCPPAIIAYARERLLRGPSPVPSSSSTAHCEGQHNLWASVSRLMSSAFGLRPQAVRYPGRPTTIAHVRQFTECDLGTKRPTGELRKRWFVEQSSISADIEEEPDPDFYKHESGVIQIAPTLIINFAICEGEHTCALEVIEWSGVTERFVCRLNTGPFSETLGEVVGEIWREYVPRNALDLCMPAGWRPRVKKKGASAPDSL